MLFWILSFVALVLLYKWFTQKPEGFPPGPSINPIFGSFPKKSHIHLLIEDFRKEYGNIVGLQVIGKYFIFVCGGRESLEAMKKEEFIGRPPSVSNQAPRPGISFTDGEHWFEQRKFTTRHLREFGLNKKAMDAMIQQESEELFTKVIDKQEKHLVNPLFNTSGINILWAIMGGDRFSYDDKELKNLCEALDKYFHSEIRTGRLKQLKIVQKLFPKWSGVYEKQIAEGLLIDFLQRSIKEHKQTMSEKPRDFIDLYLKELQKPDIKSSYSEETLMAICMDLFSGGAQAISNSMSFLILYLVLYPEWEEKVFNEIDSFIGKERKPSLDDKKWLPITEAFMSEVVRCNTISPITVPRRSLIDTTFEGYTIPKDSLVFISQWGVLHDKEHWGDPENFRPERFLNEDGSYRRDDWLAVFGGGKRVCVGESYSRMVLFSFFVSLVQRYKITLPEGNPKPSTFPVPGFTLTAQPFEAIFKRRTEN